MASPEMRWGLVLEESRGGEEEITTSTNVLVAHDELLSWDRKYFSEEKDMKSIVGANSILYFQSSPEVVLFVESKIQNCRRY